MKRKHLGIILTITVIILGSFFTKIGRTQEVKAHPLNKCPSNIYLKGANRVGVFSDNGGMLTFQFEESKLPQGSCLYSRPNNVNYAEFVTAPFPSGSKACRVAGRDRFICSGGSNTNPIVCPQMVAIGPLLQLSYGSGQPIRVSRDDAIGDRMTLHNLIKAEIMDKYGPSGKPVIRCNYMGFNKVRFVKHENQ